MYMVTVGSASALITGVSISSAASALILSTVQNKENIEISTMSIIWTGVLILLAFLSSMAYLFYAEFGANIIVSDVPDAKDAFLAASFFAFFGAYIPVFASSIRDLRSSGN